MIDKTTLERQLTLKLDCLMGEPLLNLLAEAADELGVELRIVGGTVRDLILNRPTKDYDLVTNGSGIEIASKVVELLGGEGRHLHLSLFRNFGTAQVKYKNIELEFVGARKESYQRHSRKPIVEDGTFQDDEERRDFTINAMSITLNGPLRGALHTPFNGLDDLEKGIIRTPLDPDITFSDDPLRMMRAVRFASQLSFQIPPEIVDSITRNARRLQIVSQERVSTEFEKILASPRPSVGLDLMQQTGLMQEYLPEFSDLMGAETRDGIGHKNNFYHTLMVVDNIAKSDLGEKLYLRLAALFHDIGKPRVKRFTPGIGWSFHNHDFVGQKMLPRIFKRIKFPLDDRMKYVQKLVRLHMRPAQLADEGVTDSAIRRLLFEAGDDIDDLMTLCECDLTSKNPQKVRKYLDNFTLVRQKLQEIEEKDRLRNFQPPIDGAEIMALYNLPPCREVGQIKEAIREAILDGVIPNEYDAARAFMLDWVEKNSSIHPLKPLES